MNGLVVAAVAPHVYLNWSTHADSPALVLALIPYIPGCPVLVLVFLLRHGGTIGGRIRSVRVRAENLAGNLGNVNRQVGLPNTASLEPWAR